MKNQYKKAFDAISPIRSDEELLRAVLDRKAENMNTTRKIGKKAIAILVAAAVVLGMTVVGVGAAYQWNLSAAFEGLFRDRSERLGEKADPGIDFSRLGTEIGQSFEGEGYTLTVDGVVAASETAYFIYTIRFGEDFPYDYRHQDIYGNATGWFDWDIEFFGLEFSLNGEPWKPGLKMDSIDHRWIDEQTMQSAFRVDSYGIPLENKTLTLTIDDISRSRIEKHVPVEEQSVECGFSVDVNLDEKMFYKSVTVESNVSITLDGIGGVVITEVEVSPFRVNYIVISDDGREVDDMDLWYALIHRGAVVIILRDGSIIETDTTRDHQADGGVRMIVDSKYPVDPAEVASVRIGDTVIDLTDR